MRVLAFASQKGGSGKSTLAGHIAVQAERMGAGPVAVLDTDPQGSLSAWHHERPEDSPVFVHTTERRLAQDVQILRTSGIKLLVIDTPPAITSTIGRVIELSDLVVIPTRPSPHDLRAVGATVALAEGFGKALVFVINGATPRARITAEAAIALSQHGTVAPVIVHQRVGFAASMIDGRTVMEQRGPSRSPTEIADLWTFVIGRLVRQRRVKSAAKKSAAAGPKAKRTAQKVTAAKAAFAAKSRTRKSAAKKAA